MFVCFNFRSSFGVSLPWIPIHSHKSSLVPFVSVTRVLMSSVQISLYQPVMDGLPACATCRGMSSASSHRRPIVPGGLFVEQAQHSLQHIAELVACTSNNTPILTIQINIWSLEHSRPASADADVLLFGSV